MPVAYRELKILVGSPVNIYFTNAVVKNSIVDSSSCPFPHSINPRLFIITSWLPTWSHSAFPSLFLTRYLLVQSRQSANTSSLTSDPHKINIYELQHEESRPGQWYWIGCAEGERENRRQTREHPSRYDGGIRSWSQGHTRKFLFKFLASSHPFSYSLVDREPLTSLQALCKF